MLRRKLLVDNHSHYPSFLRFRNGLRMQHRLRMQQRLRMQLQRLLQQLRLLIVRHRQKTLKDLHGVRVFYFDNSGLTSLTSY